MPKESVKTKSSTERLKTLRHKNHTILVCDFSNCTRDEGMKVFDQLVERLEKESEDSVRLLICTQDATYDPARSNAWKKHLGIFNSRLKKSAVIGLSALSKIALKGVHMYARLMGHEKIAVQAQIFDTREEALDYLVS